MSKRGSSDSDPPGIGGDAIAAEIKKGRGVDPATNRGTMSQDALSRASGVNFATVRWLEMGKTEHPEDWVAAKLYDALPAANPTDTPLLALARARWALDPRSAGLDAARAALAQVEPVLLPGAHPGSPSAADAAIAQGLAAAQAADPPLSGTQPASPRTLRDAGGAGEAT